MSDWIGPNTYRIENFQNRGAAVAVKDGENVVQKSNMADAADLENQWTIAYVGSGQYYKKDEYLIINRASKGLLTCPGVTNAAHRQAQLTVTHGDPGSWQCRWNISPTRNNTGTFFITSSGESALKLIAEGGTTADSAKIQTWRVGNEFKGSWWYLELAVVNQLQTLDLGAAPKHCGH